MKDRILWDRWKTPWIARLGVTLGAMLGLTTASCHGTGNGSQAGGGASGTTESTGGTTATVNHVCEDPVPLLQSDGADSGFVQCADGSTDHAKSVTCVLANLPGTCDPTSTYGGDCKTAADCSAHPHGACNVRSEIA